MIEDWTCPTAIIHPDTRKRSGIHDGMMGSGNVPGGLDAMAPGVEMQGRKLEGNGAFPVHLILIVIGCLLLLLIVVGFMSYYKAIRS